MEISLQGGPRRRHAQISGFFAVFHGILDNCRTSVVELLVRPSANDYLVSSPIKTGRTVVDNDIVPTPATQAASRTSSFLQHACSLITVKVEDNMIMLQSLQDAGLS